jgi:hypothetical protein
MRKSRVLLAGVAVAAAAAATSAFTAGNTVPDSVAGFGAGDVTGANVTNIHYVQDGTNPDRVNSVVFTTDTQGLAAPAVATMTLTDGGSAVGTAYDCAFGSYSDADANVVTPDVMDITCVTNGLTGTRLFSEFDSVGLSVIQ